MSSSGQVLQDMTSLLRHALEKSHGLDPRLCSQCGKISELLGYTVNTNFPPVSSKASEAPGGQACACAEVGRVYPFNGKHFCSNCKRQVITPNWRGFSNRVARLIWPDNSEAFPGMSSPEQVAANKTLNERQWKSISDLIFNEILAMFAPAAPSERADDVLTFYRLHKEACPNCGANLGKLHPEANLTPHFVGTCQRRKGR